MDMNALNYFGRLGFDDVPVLWYGACTPSYRAPPSGAHDLIHDGCSFSEEDELRK